MKKMLKRALAPALGALSLLALTGCYAYPVGYTGGGYGYYAPAAPVVVAPVYAGGYGYWRGGGRWR